MFRYFKFLGFFFYVQKLVTGLTIRENDQIYEILGWPLINTTACGTRRTSQERQTSRVACVGFNSSPKTVPDVYRPNSLL